ncbi:hypothetical protein CTM45_08610 [Prevotella intermedia]|nr:hypothetical protein CTM45_08610 [Prevotella intermedia]
MNCYRIYSFFIHKLSNAAKVINKGHLRGFSLPNVHYAVFLCFLTTNNHLHLNKFDSSCLH